MNRSFKFTLAVVGTAGLALLAASLLEAKAPYLKAAKEKFPDAKDCGYCHVKPKGGKELNERGQWMVEQKKAKDAKAVDVAWLADYKPAATPAK